MTQRIDLISFSCLKWSDGQRLRTSHNGRVRAAVKGQTLLEIYSSFDNSNWMGEFLHITFSSNWSSEAELKSSSIVGVIYSEAQAFTTLLRWIKIFINRKSLFPFFFSPTSFMWSWSKQNVIEMLEMLHKLHESSHKRYDVWESSSDRMENKNIF